MEKLMTVLADWPASKRGQEQRRSERTIPFVSDEEMVLIDIGCQRPTMAKMLDLSEGGTLVYVIDESDFLETMDTECRLTLYHQGKVFEVESKVARRSGRLIGLEFVNPPSIVMNRIQAKLIQMEAEWMRVKRQITD